MLRKLWIIYVAVGIVGALIGVAIAGKPTSADKRHFAEVTVTSTTDSSLPASTTSSVPVPSSSPTSTSTSVTTSSAPADSPTAASIAPARQRSEVRLVVANGANRDRLAAAVVGSLIHAGWVAATATNSLRSSATSHVYFRAGFEAEAAQVVNDMGHPLPVEPMPDSNVSASDAQADVLVLLGSDYPG